MKTHQSYSKLEVSHKPNIFFGTYEQRLIDWKNIRSNRKRRTKSLEILSNIFLLSQEPKQRQTNTKDTWLELGS